MRLVNADHAPVYLNEEACKQIKNMPTVDAVEVVRCRDCVLRRRCIMFDTFRFAGLENPFCCAGLRKEGADGG